MYVKNLLAQNSILNQLYQRLLLVLVFMLLATVGLQAQNTYSNAGLSVPTVTSDKDDYAPGEIATITGSGWTLDSIVDVHFEEEPAHDHHHGYHDTKVNADGTWEIRYQIEERHLGVKFTVVVDGKQSGYQGLAYFTDAQPTKITLIASKNPSSIDETIKFTATVQRSTGNANQLNNVSGILQFYINGVEIDGSQTIANGSNIKFISVNGILTAGNNEVKAIFTGKDNTSPGNNGFEDSEAELIQVVTKNLSTIELSDLIHTYNGSAKSATATTNPANLTGVTISYKPENADESSFTTDAPVNAGTYDVKAILNNANYTADPVTGKLTINKASQTIVWANPTVITYGTALSATQLNAALTAGDGLLSYAPALNTVLDAGNNQTLSVTAAATTNYNQAQATVAINVLKATPTVNLIVGGPYVYDGNAKAVTSATVTGINSTDLGQATVTYKQGQTIVEAPTDADLYEVTATFAENTNYNLAQATGTLIINKAQAGINVSDASGKVYTGASQLITVATVPSGLAGLSVKYSQNSNEILASAVKNAGEYTYEVSLDNPNYAAAPVSNSFTIAKAPSQTIVSVIGSSFSYTGAPIEPANVSVTGAGGLSLTPAATYSNNINAGEATASYSFAGDDNHLPSSDGKTFTIGKATLTIAAANATKVYGDPKPDFSGSIVSGAVQGETFAITADSDADARTGVGTNPIVPAVTGATLANYTVVKNNGILTITERPITVTADAGQTKVYGENDPAAFTYKVTSGNLVNGDQLSGALSRVPGDDVAAYTITQNSLAATANYTLTYVGADFTITQRPVTVTADSKSKVYGSEDPVLTYTVSDGSVINGDDFTGILERGPGEDVDSYEVILGNLSLGNNYSLNLALGTVFTITPKTITVNPTAGQFKVYGNDDPVFAFTNTDLVGTDAFTGALSREPGSNVGTYAITKGSLALSSNYTLNVVDGITFQIRPKTLVASISASDKIYDGSDEANATASVPAADIVGNDAVKVTVSNAIFDSKNVGYNKTVTAGVSISNANYSLSNATASTTANITAKDITGSFTAASKVYDGTTNATASDLKLTGVISPDDVELTGGTATFADKNADTGKTVTLTGASLSGADKDNYNLTNVATASANISPKPASVTLLANSKVYGEVDPDLDGTLNDFIAADGITADYSREPGEIVNIYAISATLSPAAALTNYDITYNPASFEITKATLTVTADDQNRKYGDANPALTVSYSGFVNNENATVLTQAPVGTTAANNASIIGDYPITVSGGEAANYSFNYVAGTLTISKADLAVKADDDSRLYGDANPAFTGIITGIKNNDAITATYNTVATSASSVGEYDIVPSLAGDALSNYNAPTVTNGKLTISQSPLSAIANPKTRIYGVANPELNGVLTGIKNDDEITANYSTTAEQNSDVGPYPITVSLSDPNNKLGNYTVTKNDAVLTISQAPATIALAGLSKIYNASGQGAEVTTTPANLAVTVTYDGAAALPKAAKSYAVVAALNNRNYTAGNAVGTLVITPKAITATLANPGKVYDGTKNAPGTTAALSGVISGDDVTTQVTGAQFNYANAGDRTVSATVTLGGNDKGNYSLEDVNTANATITPKEVTAQITAQSKVYDGNDVASATGSIPNTAIVSGDAVQVTVNSANFDNKHVGVDKPVYASVAISNANYKLSSPLAATTASITPAPLTITAPSMSKYCGQANPMTGYSCSVSGVVHNEVMVTTYSINGTIVLPESTDPQLSNYTAKYVNGVLTINSLALDASDASTPRSIQDDVVINVTVKDGTTNIAGVTVDLMFDGGVKASAVSNASGVATFNLGKLAVNVYAVTVSAGEGNCSVSPVVYLPIYDPDGGFVTGGGWINSTAGALEGSDATGKANFGFVAKYKKGKNEVEGNTEFQFQAGNINFKSSAHDAGSLVISGAKATYKGTGTIAGRSGTYNFMVAATDGQINGGGGYDKFRIKIWNGGNVVYDNARGTLENAELGDETRLGGGSIVIHEVKSASKGSKLEVAKAAETTEFYNYPNTFTDKTTIAFSLDKEESYSLEVYDMRGALIKKVDMGVAKAGKLYEYEFSGVNISKGIYIARLITPSGARSIKMLLSK